MSTSVRELQMALLDMLVKIDELCKKYEINYSLSSGTVLGAVRHGGFIPWDDDLDLMFVREEYEKFLRIPNEEFQRCGFTLQKAFTKEWPMFFSKVRKNGTTFIEKYPNKLMGASIDRDKSIYPREMFEEYTSVEFEGKTFPVIKDYKKYLEITYGNYMELPPEKDRLAAIHAEYVDLNKSYEEYVK